MASESNSRTSSPTVSRIGSPEPQPQQERQQSRRRNRSRAPRSPSVGTSSDGARPTRRRRRGQQGPLDDLQNPAGQLTQKPVVGLTDTAKGLTGGLVGGQQEPEQGGSGGKDTLKLRLDINLDIEVTIKAKVHGDVTLSLLD